MRHFEERLGFRLLNRTTCSASLTDAGLRLLDRLRPAVDQISCGREDLKGEQGHLFGRREESYAMPQISPKGQGCVGPQSRAVAWC
jgi:DNA-binding transcriptional LysR family regulator